MHLGLDHEAAAAERPDGGGNLIDGTDDLEPGDGGTGIVEQSAGLIFMDLHLSDLRQQRAAARRCDGDAAASRGISVQP
jgi:hypothetical protein